MGKDHVINNKKLMKEWDWNKNNSVFVYPNKLTMGSNTYAWWKCPKCGHEWKSKISNRAILGRGCPCCANRVIVKGVNDLKTLRPELAKEWDNEKNIIGPDEVSVGSGQKVWWKCKQGHSYQATILHRTYGDGTSCPICNSGRQSSFAEQCVYFYVKKQYPDAINRYKSEWLNKMELDIFIPSINYAIEYDGQAWHNDEKILIREEQKYRLCKENNVKLIRLREKFAPLLSNVADYQLGDNKDLYKESNLEIVIEQLLSIITFHSSKHFDINIKRDKKFIQNYLIGDINESFAEVFPEMAKEWNYERNGQLTPNKFKPHSDHKVWWRCSKCGYEYEATLGHRAYGTGCPKCAIQRNAERHRMKVAMLDDNNNILQVFDSITEAREQTGINRSNISSVCKGQRQKAGGYRWKYI